MYGCMDVFYRRRLDETETRRDRDSTRREFWVSKNVHSHRLRYARVGEGARFVSSSSIDRSGTRKKEEESKGSCWWDAGLMEKVQLDGSIRWLWCESKVRYRSVLAANGKLLRRR